MSGVGELLGRLIGLLDSAGVPHMVVGSFASAFHGEARTTLDVDVVIDPTRDGLDAFLALLHDDQYYVDGDVARAALRGRSQFNLIDFATGWKVDFILRKDRPFSASEFARRQRAELFGCPVFVATAEDSIVAKLEWAKLGDSDRQLRDVAGILAVHREKLDLAYIARWVDSLDLAEQWSRVRGAL